MDFLIYLLRIILETCSAFSIITTPLTIFFLISKHKRKKKPQNEEYKNPPFKKWDIYEKIFIYEILISAIIGPLYSPIAFFGAGNTQIGSLLEKRCYEEQYFVQFRSSSRDKPYMLVADIEKTKDDDYVINKVHFENGGYISFSSMPVEPRKEERIPADNDEWYYITLTKEKVSD